MNTPENTDPIARAAAYSYAPRTPGEAGAELDRLKRDQRLHTDWDLRLLESYRQDSGDGLGFFRGLRNALCLTGGLIFIVAAFTLPGTRDPLADVFASALCLGLGGCCLWAGLGRAA